MTVEMLSSHPHAHTHARTGAQALDHVHHDYFPDDPEMLPTGCEVDGTQARRAVREIADYVVIGSGAAGAAAAFMLQSQGYSVAIVEEGRWVRTRTFVPDLFPSMRNLFRNAGTSAIMGRAVLPIMQGRCVGGSTTINSAIAWRPPAEVVDGWGTDFGLAGKVSMDILAPHFEMLERELHVQVVSDDALGGNNALFGVAAEAMGYESHRIQRYDRGCEGSGGCLTGCRTAKKMGMNVTFVPRTLLAGGRIFTSARVDHVDVRGGRAVGVTGTMPGPDGPVDFDVRARRGVFVAASTIQTPNLLRRSGVRSKALGRHFQAHPGVSMAGRFEDEVRQDFGAAQGYNSLHFLKKERIKLESLILPTELATARLPGFGESLMKRVGDYKHLAIWCVVIRAESEGTVDTMFGDDRVRFTMGPRDMTRARLGLKILTEMMFKVGAREVYPGVHGMPTVLTDASQGRLWDDASIDPQAYSMIATHLFGACRMGPDPRASVVAPDFSVHGVEALRVIDSSVFPTNLGVNPQHTIMAMARLGVQRALERPSGVV